MKQIKVKCYGDGRVVSEALGYSGTACEEPMNRLAAMIGDGGDLTRIAKPELNDNTTQTEQLGGG